MTYINRLARLLASEWDATDQPIEQRGLVPSISGEQIEASPAVGIPQRLGDTWVDPFLPFAQYEDGSHHLAKPQVWTDFMDAVDRAGQGPGQQRPEDALIIGGSLGLGGFASGAVPENALASNAVRREALEGNAPKGIRAYHGATSPYDGEIYNPKKSQYNAFFAAEDPAYASKFARSYGDAPRVYPVDISPDAKLFDYRSPAHTEQLASAVTANPAILSKQYLVGPETISNWIKNGDAGILEDAGVQKWLRKKGYDGWKFEDTAGLGDNRTSYGMLRPGHVFSATTGEQLFSNPRTAPLAPAAVSALEGQSQIRAYHGTTANVDLPFQARNASGGPRAFYATEDPNFAGLFADASAGPAKVYPIDIDSRGLFDPTNPDHFDRVAVALDARLPEHLRGQGVAQRMLAQRSVGGNLDWAYRDGVSAVEDAGFTGARLHDSYGPSIAMFERGRGTVKSPLTGETLFSNPAPLPLLPYDDTEEEDHFLSSLLRRYGER